MKRWKLEDGTYDGREAQEVRTSEDGGATWYFFCWYHLEARCLQELEAAGYKPAPEGERERE